MKKSEFIEWILDEFAKEIGISLKKDYKINPLEEWLLNRLYERCKYDFPEPEDFEKEDKKCPYCDSEDIAISGGKVKSYYCRNCCKKWTNYFDQYLPF